MKRKKNEGTKKSKITRRSVERTIYLILIVAMALYGFRDSEAAATLINAIKEAFSILFDISS